MYGDLGYSAVAYGVNCRVCFYDMEAALAADTEDDRAIM